MMTTWSHVPALVTHNHDTISQTRQLVTSTSSRPPASTKAQRDRHELQRFLFLLSFHSSSPSFPVIAGTFRSVHLCNLVLTAPSVGSQRTTPILYNASPATISAAAFLSARPGVGRVISRLQQNRRRWPQVQSRSSEWAAFGCDVVLRV